ncbi:acetyl-CoA C-acetyltransferase [Streptomyces spiralis]|uniref:acetyl-CoA C-acetyltransferase n=1 Tax=Streptomyces spiralis TaxID=66376 RepID=UPI0033E5C5C7
MADAVIVAASRSPIGRAYKGSLKDVRADDLAATIVRAALQQVPQLDPGDIDELILGCAQPAGEQGYGLGRIVAVLLGLDHVPGVTVQRYCASSLQSTRMAVQAIRSGDGSVYVSAGVEMVSRYGAGKSDGMPGTHNPLFEQAQQRTAELCTGEGAWTDPRLAGALPDAYVAMGQTAEHVAQLYDVSRSDQDAYAVLSQNRAEKAVADGFWRRDITPVHLPDGTCVDSDDCPRSGTTLEGLEALKPVFRPEGTVTAGNCCPLNDGAAALVIMSDTRAAELGLTPLARILSTSVSATSPEIMGITPVEASRRALAQAGMTMDDVDLVEMNEAFAAQVVASQRQLDIDVSRLNVHGGAIALGHPFGMTGARLTTTLLNALRWDDKEIGLETMCAAGGQGMAMVVQRLS